MVNETAGRGGHSRADAAFDRRAFPSCRGRVSTDCVPKEQTGVIDVIAMFVQEHAVIFIGNPV